VRALVIAEYGEVCRTGKPLVGHPRRAGCASSARRVEKLILPFGAADGDGVERFARGRISERGLAAADAAVSRLRRDRFRRRQCTPDRRDGRRRGPRALVADPAARHVDELAELGPRNEKAAAGRRRRATSSASGPNTSEVGPIRMVAGSASGNRGWRRRSTWDAAVDH